MSKTIYNSQIECDTTITCDNTINTGTMTCNNSSWIIPRMYRTSVSVGTTSVVIPMDNGNSYNPTYQANSYLLTIVPLNGAFTTSTPNIYYEAIIVGVSTNGTQIPSILTLPNITNPFSSVSISQVTSSSTSWTLNWTWSSSSTDIQITLLQIT